MANRKRKPPRRADYSAQVASVTKLLWAFRRGTCKESGCLGRKDRPDGHAHGWEPGRVWDPYQHRYVEPTGRRR